MDKLSSIPFLMELSLNSNPVARKQLFRANCVRRLPTLKFIDGREVTYEERERVELMFVSDTRSLPHSLFYVDNAQQQQQNGIMGGSNVRGLSTKGTKAALPLTAVNFRTLTGFDGGRNHPNGNGSGLSQAAQNVGSMVSQQNNNGAIQLPSVGNRMMQHQQPTQIPSRRVSANQLLNSNLPRRPSDITGGNNGSNNGMNQNNGSRVGRQNSNNSYTWRLRRG